MGDHSLSGGGRLSEKTCWVDARDPKETRWSDMQEEIEELKRRLEKLEGHFPIKKRVMTET